LVMSTFRPHSPFFFGLGRIWSRSALPVPPIHLGRARLPVTAVSKTVMNELSEYWLKACTCSGVGVRVGVRVGVGVG